MKYSDTMVSGVCFFAAAAQFILMLIVAEARYPGYHISTNYISDLGVGPSSLMFNTSIFLLGVFMVIGAYFLQRAFHDKVFTSILVLSAVGSLGVGLFPENLEPVHSVAASFVFLFGGLSALYSSRMTKPAFSVISIVLGALSYLALILFAIHRYGGLGVGGMERMIVYPVLIWTLGFACYLLAVPKDSLKNVKLI